MIMGDYGLYFWNVSNMLCKTCRSAHGIEHTFTIQMSIEFPLCYDIQFNSENDFSWRSKKKASYVPYLLGDGGDTSFPTPER
jgi:hypothetical protein